LKTISTIYRAYNFIGSHALQISFASLTRESSQKNQARLELTVNVCFKPLSIKDTYLTDNDSILFSVVPLSELSLLEKGMEELKELSNSSPFVSFFSLKIEKDNLKFKNSLMERSTKSIRIVKLKEVEKEVETLYVLKAEVLREAEKICSSFFILDLQDFDMRMQFKPILELDWMEYWTVFERHINK